MVCLHAGLARSGSAQLVLPLLLDADGAQDGGGCSSAPPRLPPRAVVPGMLEVTDHAQRATAVAGRQRLDDGKVVAAILLHDSGEVGVRQRSCSGAPADQQRRQHLLEQRQDRIAAELADRDVDVGQAVLGPRRARSASAPPGRDGVTSDSVIRAAANSTTRSPPPRALLTSSGRTRRYSRYNATELPTEVSSAWSPRVHRRYCCACGRPDRSRGSRPPDAAPASSRRSVRAARLRWR